MKKKIKIIIALSIVLTLINISLYAQDTSKSGSEDTQKGNYLDVYHSKQKAFQLKESNKNEIYRLKIIVANNGESDEKTKLKTVIENYKTAIKTLYTRNYLKSAKELEKNRDDINDLYAILAKKYRKQADDLLDKCADKLVDMELSESIEPGSEKSSQARLIAKIRIRIMVAYGQLSMAEGMEKSQKYADAISHYRVSIYHGIEILRSLAKDQDEERKIIQEYEVAMADSENKLGPGKTID